MTNMLLELEGGVKMVWGALLNVVAQKGKLEGTEKEYYRSRSSSCIYRAAVWSGWGWGRSNWRGDCEEGGIVAEQAGPWGLPKAGCV